MVERLYLSAPQIAKAIGFSRRWVTTMAAAGKIPGAYQPAGPGGEWRFEERAFWVWWQTTLRREGASWRPEPVTKLAKAPATGVGSSESPLRRRLREWRVNVSRGGSTK